MEIRKLSFSYNKKDVRCSVLKDINLKIAPNKITTIVGANGCGKSTLFNLMTKNLNPCQGKIYLNGKNINCIRQKEFAKHVAIVHQNNASASDITVEKLVSYGRTPYMTMLGNLNEEDKKTINWAMEVTRIADIKDREVATLSGGQKQRVFIAMALAQETDILILDEPTTYLDIRYQIELLEMIKMLNVEYNKTIVMVLHDMNHAVYYSDEIIGIKNGKVIVQGDPRDVVNSNMIKEVYGIDLEVKEYNNRKIILNVR